MFQKFIVSLIRKLSESLKSSTISDKELDTVDTVVSKILALTGCYGYDSLMESLMCNKRKNRGFFFIFNLDMPFFFISQDDTPGGCAEDMKLLFN